MNETSPQEVFNDSGARIVMRQPLAVNSDAVVTGRRADRHMSKVRSYREALEHPKIEACGHKYDPTRQPRMRNCDECWFTFFLQNEQLVKDTDVMFREQGGQRVVELQGIQYLRKFLGFMATMAEIQEKVSAEALMEEQ